LYFLILSRAVLNAFNAKMPVAAAHLLEFPLPGKKKVFGNQRFPLDNVGSCNLGGYFEATRAHDWYEYLLSVLHSNVPVILIVPVHGIYED